MDRNIINKHNFVLTGFALVFLFFGVVMYHEYSSDVVTQSIIGYVVLEDGVRVSVDKMDEALVKEISSGVENPRVVVVLDEEVGREDFLDELQNEIVIDSQRVVSSGEDEGVAIEPIELKEEGLFSFFDATPQTDFVIKENAENGDAGEGARVEHIIAGEIKSADGLVELTQNTHVKKIYLDYPVFVNLDESVKQINASTVWEVVVNGSGIIGSGKSVCVIDTGVDYTHTALGGGCSPSTYELKGDVSAFNGVASSHPYSDSVDEWYVVQKEGFSTIAVHFSKIELEQISSAGDTTDRIYIYDGLNRTVAIYKGIVNEVWSPSVSGDTIYIRLVTDGSVTGYGFAIDSVINGSTNVSMDWSSCSKVIGGYDVYNNDADPKDDHGHGTHVAGIIGSTDAVYKGVAPGAGIVAIKALSGSGSGYASDVLAGIEWCRSNAQRLNISVISMSLGCDGGSCPHYQSACDDDLLSAAVAGAVDENIMVTIASGNSGWVDGISSPSCISSAIAVGGVNGGDEIKYNRGGLLQLVAPAQGIMSTVLSNGWKSLSGTSMATPHVAGAVVLLQDYVLRVNGSVLGVNDVKSRLALSGKNVADSGSGLNFSRIDVYGALGVVGNISLDVNNTNLLNESLNETVGNITNGTLANGTNTSVGDGVGAIDVSVFGEVMRSVANVTINDSVLFSVRVNASVLNVSTVGLSYQVNVVSVVNETQSSVTQSNVTNLSMVLNETSGLFGVVVNNSAWLANTTVVYWASAFDLFGNYTQSDVFNFTVQIGVGGANISNGSSVPNESGGNSSVVNETIAPVIAFNVTAPLNGSKVEVGSGVLSYGISGLGGNDSVLWLFGDGTNSTLSAGEKLFNSTGSFVVQVVHTGNGTSKMYTRTVVVNDTVGPVISNVSFGSVVDYSLNGSQVVKVDLFDYSFVGVVNSSIGNLSAAVSCTNGTITKSCVWNLSSLSSVGGLGKKELLVTVFDGYSVANKAEKIVSFIVTACKDGVKNGDETGVDCGGSCSNCAVNASLVNVSLVNASVVPEVPVVAPVVENTASESDVVPEVKAPVAEVKKVEQPVNVAAATEEKSAPVVNASALRVPEELVSQNVEKKYTVLYILGTMVAGLAGLYVFMMREGM